MAAWRASWEEGEDSVQAAGRRRSARSRFWMTCCAAWTTASARAGRHRAGRPFRRRAAGATLRRAEQRRRPAAPRRAGAALRDRQSLFLPVPDQRAATPGRQGLRAPTNAASAPPTTSTSTAPTSCPPTRAARRNPGCSCATRRATSPTWAAPDNNPEHRLLDKTCGAEAQGSTRLARGTAPAIRVPARIARRQAGHAAPRRLRSARRGPRRQEHVRLGMRRPGPVGRRRARDGQGRALRADQAARQVAPARRRPGRPQNDSKLNAASAARAISRGREQYRDMPAAALAAAPAFPHSGKQQGPP